MRYRNFLFDIHKKRVIGKKSSSVLPFNLLPENCMTGILKPAFLITLLSCMGNLHKPYTKVSVNKQIELLDKKHNKKIKRRWCFQIAADLIKEDYITRKPRYERIGRGFIKQLSSMYAFTLKGANWLISMRIEAGIVIRNQMFADETKDDKRWPTKEDYLNECNKKMDEQEGRLSGNPIIDMVPGYD